MSVISVSKLRNIIPAFIDNQILPNITTDWKRFAIGGATGVVMLRFDNFVADLAPKGRSMQVLTQDGKLDIAVVKAFLDGGFKASPTVQMPAPLNLVVFDQPDADAFIRMLEENKDD